MYDRMLEFVRLLLSDGRIRGRDAIVELVAIGAAESGLDNLAVGNNAKNGTPPASAAYYDLGIGWLQVDTYWLQRNIDAGHWPADKDWRTFRADAYQSIDYLVTVPGFVLYQGQDDTYIKYENWNVWPAKSDPFKVEARRAYDEVMAEG